MHPPTRLQIAIPEHNIWVDEHNRTFMVMQIIRVNPFALHAAMTAAGANADAPEPELQQAPAFIAPSEAPAPTEAPALPDDVQVITPRS